MSVVRRAMRARRALAPALRAASLAGLALGCDSTALSLTDPNELNATLDPPFLQPDEMRHNGVVLTLNDRAEDTAGDVSTNYVFNADFGQGMGATGYQFTSNFALTFDLLRFAEAAPGKRTFTIQFHNYYGDFLARGELTVYGE